ncbi:MAG TPA: cytochrome c oxidase assembly protein [Paucimonas sp.]|nr:cytochrome c oxidase assembly protein [Paucimonas sp.]
MYAAVVLSPSAVAHAPATPQVTAALVWEFDPWAAAGLLIAALLYGVGSRRQCRGDSRMAAVPKRRAVCFSAGIGILALALVSPLDGLGGELFSMHMLQHELIMLGAAPLIVAGRPLPVFLRTFPRSGRKRIGRFVAEKAIRLPWRALMQPLPAWMLHAAVLWIWHLPRLFQAGLQSELVHALQHASFLLSALLFWSSLSAARAHRGTAVLSMLTTMIHTGILGALLTFSPRAWYPAYTGKTDAWGLTLLEDQQLGGLIMWVPAGFVFIAAGLALAAQALTRRAERPA